LDDLDLNLKSQPQQKIHQQVAVAVGDALLLG